MSDINNLLNHSVENIIERNGKSYIVFTNQIKEGCKIPNLELYQPVIIKRYKENSDEPKYTNNNLNE